jgi:hypothetical protein
MFPAQVKSNNVALQHFIHFVRKAMFHEAFILFQPLSITKFPNFTELPEDETKNKSHCEGKNRHSLRSDNAAGSSITAISNVVFLQFATQAAILIHGFWQW